MSWRTGVFLGLFVVVAPILSAPLQLFANTLTDQQKRDAQALGLDPNAANIQEVLGILSGGCDTNPFPELQARYALARDVHTGQPLKLTPRAAVPGQGTDGINPVLACRLLKLFQALEREQGCVLKISSAYRSGPEQDRMCGNGRTGCLAAGKSCHNYGLGVDIQGACVERLRAFLGKQNPTTEGARRFGLHFPYSGPHLQCSEDRVANCSSNRGCGSNFAINSDTSGFPRTGAPSYGVSNYFRSALGMQPVPPPQPILPPQPLTMSQPITNAFTQPATDFIQPMPLIPPGTTTSIADQLLHLIGSTTPSTSTSTATTVPIVITGSSAGTIVSVTQTPVQQATTSFGRLPVGQQTFSSNNPDWQKPQPIYQTDTYSRLVQLYTSLRDVLARLADYLKPFGRPHIHTEHEVFE